MKMINSSAFQIRLFNCHLHMQYASKKNSTILQRPLTIKKKDEGKSKVVVLWKAPSPGAGCCRGRETATGGKYFFPNRFWRLPIYFVLKRIKFCGWGSPVFRSFYSCSIWAPNPVQIWIKSWPAHALAQVGYRMLYFFLKAIGALGSHIRFMDAHTDRTQHK